MKNRGKFLPGLLSLMMLCTFALGLPLTAAAGEEKLIANDDDDTSSSSSSSSSSRGAVDGQGDGDFTVTGYRTAIYNQQTGNFDDITTIAPGQRFVLLLDIHDGRVPETFKDSEQRKGLIPQAKMNSISFKPYGESTIFRNDSGRQWQNDGLRYTINFDIVYTGKGKTFECDIYYTDLNNKSHPVNMPYETCTVTLNNVEDQDDISSSSDESGSTRGTMFALQTATYGDTAINAGAAFKLDVTMIATNGTYGLENVSATLVPDKEITFATGTSTVYIGSVSPGQSIPLSFELKAGAAAEDGSYKVTVNMHGVNAKDGTEANTEVDLSIPVIQPDRLEIANAQMPDFVTTNESDSANYGSINIVNKGKSEVYNVSVAIAGEGLRTTEGSIYLGTMAAGSQNNADFTIVGEYGGTSTGTVTVTYENVRGEEKTLTHDFDVTISETDPEGDSGMIEPPMPEEEEDEVPWGLIIGIGVAVLVVAGVVVLVIVLKKRKAQKEAELEDEDEDDDDEDF